MKYPPEYATMSYAERARWHATEARLLATEARWYADRAKRLARVAILLAVLSAASTALTLAYMVTR